MRHEEPIAAHEVCRWFGASNTRTVTVPPMQPPTAPSQAQPHRESVRCDRPERVGGRIGGERLREDLDAR